MFIFSGSLHRNLRSQAINKPQAEVGKSPRPSTRLHQQLLSQVSHEETAPPLGHQRPAPTVTVADNDEIDGAGMTFEDTFFNPWTIFPYTCFFYV